MPPAPLPALGPAADVALFLLGAAVLLALLRPWRADVPLSSKTLRPPNLLNTHPAYLPEFPGAHGVRDALAAGVSETGASVIVVDDGVDSGPIVAQRRVPVLPGDTEARLHDRIKLVERELLVQVVLDIANGHIELKELS